MPSPPTLVNIVGTGQVEAEINFQTIIEDLPVETSYIKGPGLYFKFEEDFPTIIVARSGKYIAGAGCEEVAEQAFEHITSIMNQLDSP